MVLITGTQNKITLNWIRLRSLMSFGRLGAKMPLKFGVFTGHECSASTGPNQNKLLTLPGEMETVE
uniref:Uncharacterized protein n=1 Tax=Arundo donax TaxID=35708 RepID=A0A0A9AHM9_ARUDO